MLILLNCLIIKQYLIDCEFRIICCYVFLSFLVLLPPFVVNVVTVVINGYMCFLSIFFVISFHHFVVRSHYCYYFSIIIYIVHLFVFFFRSHYCKRFLTQFLASIWHWMAISKYLKHGVIAEINDWKGVDLAERFCSAYPIFSTASMVINFQPWQCCKLATAGLRMNYRWSPYELQMAIKRWSTLYLRGSREGSVKKSKQFLHIFSSHFSIRIWSLVLAALFYFGRTLDEERNGNAQWSRIGYIFI